eukprot:TRINITY_DN2037_c0_g1_i1.p1 TRINITY_DN2037_c0_g1~~TRINITY_DN2037_c0_g1_i1.p1  ORF type:complete len:254 (-),score=56.84 TRINITY_DN2037_c0_g1_i1:248-967(-)
MSKASISFLLNQESTPTSTSQLSSLINSEPERDADLHQDFPFSPLRSIASLFEYPLPSQTWSPNFPVSHSSSFTTTQRNGSEANEEKPSFPASMMLFSDEMRPNYSAWSGLPSPRSQSIQEASPTTFPFIPVKEEPRKPSEPSPSVPSVNISGQNRKHKRRTMKQIGVRTCFLCKTKSTTRWRLGWFYLKNAGQEKERNTQDPKFSSLVQPGSGLKCVDLCNPCGLAYRRRRSTGGQAS